MQVMTVVEGVIPGNMQDGFVREYRALIAKRSDAAAPVESILLRESGSGMLWRIASLWRSRQDLDEMRKVNDVPPAVRLFQEAGAEPTIRVFDVVESFGP